MDARAHISLKFGRKDSRNHAASAVQRSDTAHALAIQLSRDAEALRLSLELFEQINAAGLEPNDPRIESLPAAVELAGHITRQGALWD